MFYHLTRSSVDQLLTPLIARSLKAGWHVEVRGRQPGRMTALDEALWRGDGFVPHGLAGGAHDARQPVLLTIEGQAAANAAKYLIAVDGAEVTGAEMDDAGLERACIVFDGNDPEALDRARDQWRALRAAGAEAQYWSEAGGRWERKQ